MLKSLRHRAAAIAAATVIAAPLLVLSTQTAARADNPQLCYVNSATVTGTTWTHGNPNKGLIYRNGYAYVDMKSDSACPIGADGYWHILAVVQLNDEVLSAHLGTPSTALGTADGESGESTVNSTYTEWLGFAKASSGVTTETLDGDPSHVTTTSDTATCKPDTTNVTCTTTYSGDSWQMNLRWDGDSTSGDYFGLSTGSDARFRWAQETDPSDTDTYVRDTAVFCIVASSTSTTCESTTG